MKKLMIGVVAIMFVMGGLTLAEGVSFEKFVRLVTDGVVPDGYAQDKDRTMDMRSRFHIEFLGDKAKSEKISISLATGKKEFSAMDKLGDPESYKFKGRPAMYKDGEKVGMAGFLLLLNNQKGVLAISHRVFGGKFLVKADFEKMVEKIGLENLEK